MKLIIILWITLLVRLGKASEDTGKSADLLKKIQLGTQAGAELIKAFGEEGVTRKFIGFFANKVGYFLGALGPMIALITSFLPASESPQMKLIKKGFAEVEAKFDQTLTKFEKLQNQIIELSTRKIWAPREMEIIQMSSLLHQYFNSYNDSKNATVFKDIILEQGITGCRKAVRAIYWGLITNPVFGGNIQTAIFEYSDGNRTQTNITVTQVYLLLLSGASTIVSYYHLDNRTRFAQIMEQYWTTRMDNAASFIQEKDKSLKFLAELRIDRDISNKLAEFFKLDDKTFADELFNFLTSKYYWKDWFLALLPKSDTTYVKVKQDCKETTVSFGKHKRNLVVVGVEKTKSHIDAEELRKNLQQPSLFNNCPWSPYAECLYNLLPKKIREGCNVPGLIVINAITNPNFPLKMTNETRFFHIGQLYRGVVAGPTSLQYRHVYAYG